MADEQHEGRTPTETLVKALEDFGEQEPNFVFVVIENPDGSISWRVSYPHSVINLIGLLECLKEEFKARFLNLPSSEI